MLRGRVLKIVLCCAVLPVLSGPSVAAAGDAGTESAGTQQGRSCRAPEQVEPPEGDAEKPPSVAGSEQVQVRDLGRERTPVTFLTVLTLSEPLPSGVQHLNTMVGPFTRRDGRALEPEQVVAQATVSPGRHDTVVLHVCVDPVVADSSEKGAMISAHAGSYTGSVAIDDPRVNGGGASYTVNMTFTAMWLVVVVWLGALLAGMTTGLTLASGLSWSWWRTRETAARAVTAGVGGVAAGVTVLTAQYVNDPSWQGDFNLFLALVVTTAGAGYAATNFAGSVSSVARPVGGGKSD